MTKIIVDNSEWFKIYIIPIMINDISQKFGWLISVEKILVKLKHSLEILVKNPKNILKCFCKQSLWS